jgi:putative colanic acid biosynthesis UDP-glucose lipid carrier transferase
LISLGIKLTSIGPVLYRQDRVSWNGKIFPMYKFRSMPVNTEASSGAVWAKDGEVRATSFGAFLRRTSLDELPQFFNVLKGDMSIVGPRPERPVFVDQFKDEVPGYMKKHKVKAGITGWAQVNGWRGDTCIKTRVEHDLYYINTWSLWFDLKIIVLTLFKGFVHKNAY